VPVAVGVFVALSGAWAWLTPAWEANDEPDHVANIQTIAAGHLPVVGENIEAAQPPLYYAVGAVWQRLWGIEEIPSSPRHSVNPSGPQLPQFAHDYTPSERAAAMDVHVLRMLSVLAGAVTVLLTYVIARRVGGSWQPAFAAALTVAVWPRFTVISGAVQNDSLVITLCAATLWATLTWIRTAKAANGRVQLLWPCVAGVLAGSAVLTKFTAIPVVLLLLAAVAAQVFASRRRAVAAHLVEIAVAVGSGLGVCGGYLLRNHRLYGELLATDAGADYLRKVLPDLVEPVSWLDSERFLAETPRGLMETVWFVGGWNQLTLPFGLQLALTVVAAASFVGAVRHLVRRMASSRERSTYLLERVLPILAVLAGAAGAFLLITKETTQVQGRYLFTAIGPMAMGLVVGCRDLAVGSPVLRRLALFAWPLLMLATNLYAMHLFLWPAPWL
jgi:4-amino-4-deoxy-L-arabinose transferase-like glycosyltransferase